MLVAWAESVVLAELVVLAAWAGLAELVDRAALVAQADGARHSSRRVEAAGSIILSIVAERRMRTVRPRTGLVVLREATHFRIGKARLGSRSAGRAAI